MELSFCFLAAVVAHLIPNRIALPTCKAKAKSTSTTDTARTPETPSPQGKSAAMTPKTANKFLTHRQRQKVTKELKRVSEWIKKLEEHEIKMSRDVDYELVLPEVTRAEFQKIQEELLEIKCAFDMLLLPDGGGQNQSILEPFCKRAQDIHTKAGDIDYEIRSRFAGVKEFGGSKWKTV